MSLGEKIKLARKNKKLTQHEFAAPMGFSGTYLSEIEKGKKPVNERFLLLLKSVYGIDLTESSQYDTETITHPLIKESPREYGEYTDEEREYAKKLVQIMRTKMEGTVLAIKQNIDAFLTTPDKEKKNSQAA